MNIWSQKCSFSLTFLYLQAILETKRDTEEEEVGREILREIEGMERVEQDMKIVKFNDKISEILIVDFSLRSSLQFRNKKTRKQSQNKENLTIRNKMQQQRNKEVFNDATENVNEMVADDPLAQFSFEQFDNLPSDNYNNKNKKDKNKKKSTKKLFSKSTKIRKLEKSKLVSKPVSRRRLRQVRLTFIRPGKN